MQPEEDRLAEERKAALEAEKSQVDPEVEKEPEEDRTAEIEALELRKRQSLTIAGFQLCK